MKSVKANEYVSHVTNGVKISKLLYYTCHDFSVFMSVLNKYMRFIYIMGAGNSVYKRLRVAHNSKDLYTIAGYIEEAENKDIDIDKLNVQELEIYCIVFDNKYNECLHDNFLLWKSTFDDTFESSVYDEIREYIEACSN